MEDWIGLRAYARHRRVALSAVQKAIATKRVTVIRRNERGHVIAIERHAADQQWTANTDPVEAARNGKLEAPPPGAAAPLPDTACQVDGGLESRAAAGNAMSGAAVGEVPAGVAAASKASAGIEDQGDYLAARAKREGFLAKQAELDYLEKIGVLVATAEVQREMSEIFTQLKSNVFRISDRKAQILAAEADPARVHRLLSEEFRTVFDEFSNRLSGDAAAGTAEREAALP